MQGTLSLQEQFSPHSACFGCGPDNSQGLKIRSYPSNDQVIAHWQPEKQYEAFPGVLNGGIIGTLLDCHSNWAAAWFLMQQANDMQPPCTVTAAYAIKLLRPTPTKDPIELVAQLLESTKDSAIVSAKLIANNKICATCEGKFVAVKPGHPGYYRW